MYCGDLIKCTRPDVSCCIVCFGEQMVTPREVKINAMGVIQNKKRLSLSDQLFYFC